MSNQIPLTKVEESSKILVDSSRRGLDSIAEEGGFQFHERRFNLQRNIAYSITAAFLIINFAVCVWLYQIWTIEQAMLEKGIEFERLVSSEVIMALLAATAAQLGTVTVAMARHLFPGSGNKEND